MHQADVPAAAPISFRLLGPVTAEADGRPLDLGGVRQARLLALLLLSPRVPIPVDRIIAALWDEPPRSVRQQVHNAVAALRRTLADVPGVEITRSDVGYGISTPDELIDAHRFGAGLAEAERLAAAERVMEAAGVLRAALDLWAGPALTGLDAPVFRAAADRLDQQRLTAAERLAALRIRLGEAESVVGELTALVVEHPLHEPLRAALMLALHHSGREAEALALYDETRRLFADELGADPGTRLRALHAKILRGEPVEAGSVAPVRNVAPVNSLPRTVNEFTGRIGELAELLDRVRDNGSAALVISAIDGMGGVGKTSLALRLAHEIADGYADGCHFLDLHGYSVGREPVSPVAALEELLREAGVPAELIPKEPDAKERLWRTHMAGRNALLVLDNARDEAQVRPLLPASPTTTVIVTSRRRLTALEDVHPLSLDLLPVGDAVELFTRIVGEARVSAERAAVGEVVELCGRLPLAIRIAAARLRDRKAWSLADLLARLRDEGGRTRFLEVGDRGVAAALRVSYEYLPEEEKRLFRLLALHPGSVFDAYSAAALCGMGVAEAEDGLEALYEQSLLLQPEAGRYEFHDLVRDCATELAEGDEEEEREEAVDRVLDYYLALMAGLGAAWPTPTVPFEAEVEHTPVLPCTLPVTLGEARRLLALNYQGAIAASLMAHVTGRHRRTWQIACLLNRYVTGSGYGIRALEFYTPALKSAQAIGDLNGEVLSLSLIAMIQTNHGADALESPEAELLTRRAIDLSTAANEPNWALNLSVNLAYILIRSGRLREAYETCTNGREAAERLGRIRPGILMVQNLVVICKMMGRFDESKEYLDVLDELVEEHGTPQFRPSLKYARGFAAYIAGAMTEALAELDSCAALSKEMGDGRNYASAHELMATIHRSQGVIGKALEHGRIALTTAREMGNKLAEGIALAALGDVHVTAGDLISAEASFQTALTIEESIGSPMGTSHCLEGLAHVRRAAGDLEGARELWTRATALLPPDMYIREFPRRHLDGLDDPATTCLRCVVSTTPYREPLDSVPSPS